MRWTLRLRLTLVYGALFLATGVVLLAVTYVLAVPPWAGIEPPAPPDLGPLPGITLPEIPAADLLERQRDRHRHRLLVSSGIALGLMTLVSVGLGWWMAGRVLRPLRTLAVTAKSISAHDLHQRLAAPGPADEITDLADTFDALLDRLGDAFEAQRRFVANASHELRTPLAYERSLLEVTLADPDATAADLRDTCRRVLASNQRQGEVIEALLTLARSQRGLDRRTDLDLAVLTEEILDADIAGVGSRIEADLNSAPISGDRSLVERLIANLVDNARRHNVTDGWVKVWTGIQDGRPALRIRNSGPEILPAQIDSLFQPFQRLNVTRTNGRKGLGVGLSIVAAIATAHGAATRARPLPGGGLDLQISWPVHGDTAGRPEDPRSTASYAGRSLFQRG